MYVPNSFAVNDPARLYDFIEQNSFAILFTAGGKEPIASHLPLLLDREAATAGCLIGHMARANPQWRTAEGATACAVFQGPHTYISPSWYDAKNVVPTWNYVAVHVYGTVRIVTDRLRLLETLRRTVDQYEMDLPVPWSVDRPDADFIYKLLDAVVGFEIEITRMDGKWKLGQNHDRERRERVARALRQIGGVEREQIAELMLAELNRDGKVYPL